MALNYIDLFAGTILVCKPFWIQEKVLKRQFLLY